MGVYSFKSVQAALVGPGGIISLGDGSGSSDEGISIDQSAEINKMDIGADGTPMHSLSGNKSGTIKVVLLKTSPVNALLMALCNFQRLSASTHGQNVLTLTDKARGDTYTCQQVAFKKIPNNKYAKDANMIEWDFDAGIIDPLLGAGLP